MKKYKEIETIEKILDSVICDKCKKEVFDEMELDEFICVEHFGGYNSIFGDGNRIQLDLCQHCLKEIFVDIIRVCRYPYS
jgi:hypothetical protein